MMQLSISTNTFPNKVGCCTYREGSTAQIGQMVFW